VDSVWGQLWISGRDNMQLTHRRLIHVFSDFYQTSSKGKVQELQSLHAGLLDSFDSALSATINIRHIHSTFMWSKCRMRFVL